MPPPQPDPGGPQAGQRHIDAVPVPTQQRGRLDDRQRSTHPSRATPNDGQGLAGRARDREVAPFDDRRLLAGDMGDGRAQPLGVVEVDIGDRDDATVPGMGRVKAPAQPDLHEGDIQVRLRKVTEHDGREKLELGGFAMSSRHLVRHGQHRLDMAGEVGRDDGHPVDHDPLAVRHEMGLGRLTDAQPGRPEGTPGDGQDTALAVGAGDQRSPHRALRISQGPQERARPTEAQADAEPPSIGERGQGRVVLEVGRCADGRHSRVSSSS